MLLICYTCVNKNLYDVVMLEALSFCADDEIMSINIFMKFEILLDILFLFVKGRKCFCGRIRGSIGAG